MNGRKFNRDSAHRRAMLAGLVCALVKHEQITTTLAKAKDLRPVIEKLITQSRPGTLHASRLINSFLRDQAATRKLVTVLGQRYASRPGGYVRILKAGFRQGDSAPMAVIELVDRDITAKGRDSGTPPQQQEAA
jgi:large subunit ribosomal protein L17